MLDMFVLFGWICFIILWFITLLYLDSRNYYMPTIYIGASIIFFLVTCWVSYISQLYL